MTPVVSVVVACYNYGRYVTEALDSVSAQSFAGWECIVVDDGSTDDSIARITPFLADPRFRLIRTAHAGQPRAKNTAIRAARGRFLAFLDADDRWAPEKLARQLSVFEANPRAGVVYSRRRIIDAEGRVTAANDPRRMHRGDVLDAMYRDNFVCFSSAMVRREAVNTVGLFDERIPLAIDYDWWLRIARFFAFDFADEPLVDYRTGHANLSRRVGERLEIVLEIMDRFRREHDQPPRLSPAVARLALAETYRHRGLVGRQEPGAGRTWLLRSLSVRPFDATTWKALAASFAPPGLRHAWRAATGRPDWEPAPAARSAA
jgi:glycosyltransferase involved in cell wall biosynthesis